MYNRLINCLALFEGQFGFQSGHSTVPALSLLTDCIQQSFENESYSCGVFFFFWLIKRYLIPLITIFCWPNLNVKVYTVLPSSGSLPVLQVGNSMLVSATCALSTRKWRWGYHKAPFWGHYCFSYISMAFINSPTNSISMNLLWMQIYLCQILSCKSWSKGQARTS